MNYAASDCLVEAGGAGRMAGESGGSGVLRELAARKLSAHSMQAP